MEHSLCRSSAQSIAALYYDYAPYCYDVAARQALVLGTCLQLSMNGSHFCGAKGFDVRHVLCALQRIKNVGVDGGQRLLDVCH